MNVKGFALTETLVVVVFLVTIFTFIYVSMVPLIGKYENAIEKENDVDIVYKLYTIRKLIMSDDNRANIPDSGVVQINCDFLSRKTFCEKLMEHLNLHTLGEDNYVLIYASYLNNDNINSISSYNGELGEYARNNRREISNRSLFLIDTINHTMAHLYYDDTL